MRHTYYWDSGVFVAYFNDEAGRADVVGELLEAAREGSITIITSTFAYVEVLKVRGHSSLPVEAEAKIAAFFEYPFLRFVDPTRNVCEAARRLIWRYPALKPKDAVHLASAISYAERAHLDALFSYDTDFTKLHGQVTQRFPICTPFVEQRQLPLGGDAPVVARVQRRLELDDDQSRPE